MTPLGMLAMSMLVAVMRSPPPAVYWASSPTLVNETLLLAGAGASTFEFVPRDDFFCLCSDCVGLATRSRVGGAFGTNSM